jgi:hypothetical protein
MTEMLTTPEYRIDPVSLATPVSPAEAANDFQPVSLTLEMASSAALLPVLTTVARLGCRITCVHATERQAALGVLAPRRLAHRLQPCLGQLIDVLAVTEAPGVIPPSAAETEAAT